MSKKQKRMLYRILAAAVLLILAALLPLDGWVRAVVFLVPYAVMGCDLDRPAQHRPRPGL